MRLLDHPEMTDYPSYTLACIFYWFVFVGGVMLSLYLLWFLLLYSWNDMMKTYETNG